MLLLNFQEQLAGFDFKLAKFDMVIGSSTVVLNGPNVEPVNVGFPLMTNDPIPSLGLTPILSWLKC